MGLFDSSYPQDQTQSPLGILAASLQDAAAGMRGSPAQAIPALLARRQQAQQYQALQQAVLGSPNYQPATPGSPATGTPGNTDMQMPGTDVPASPGMPQIGQPGMLGSGPQSAMLRQMIASGGLDPQTGTQLLLSMATKENAYNKLGPGEALYQGNQLVAQAPQLPHYGEKSVGINPKTGKLDTYLIDDKTGQQQWLGTAPPPNIEVVNGQVIDKNAVTPGTVIPQQGEAPLSPGRLQQEKDLIQLRNPQLTPTAPGSLPMGLVGHPEIDPTPADYSRAPIGNTGLTQASIDQKALNYIASGTLPPQGRTGIAGIQNAAISNRMAEMDPGGNLAAHKTELKSLSSSLAGQQKYLDTTQRAFNTANDTLDSLQTYMQQNNINPSQFPDYNNFTNFLKARGMDPGAAGGYNAQIATLRSEYAQVLSRGGQVTDNARNEAAKLIPDGLSPAQLAKVAAQVKIDGTNVVRDAQQQVGKVSAQIRDIGKPAAQQTQAPGLPPGWTVTVKP